MSLRSEPSHIHPEPKLPSRQRMTAFGKLRLPFTRLARDGRSSTASPTGSLPSGPAVSGWIRPFSPFDRDPEIRRLMERGSSGFRCGIASPLASSCDIPLNGRSELALRRRIYSAAVRTAYANARRVDGTALRQRDLRNLVEARFAHLKVVDTRLMHRATPEGLTPRRVRPNGGLVFGGRPQLQRRSKGLISRVSWRELRRRPLCSRRDATQSYNRHSGYRSMPQPARCPSTDSGLCCGWPSCETRLTEFFGRPRCWPPARRST